MTPRLFVRRIVVTGPGRNYEVGFEDGVNVIAGPISTGKSSILQLIDYACGAKAAPDYPEITKCSDVYVQFEVGSETLTVRRSLKNANAKATLYTSAIEQVFAGGVAGTDVSPRHDPNHASISSEILRRLDLGNIEVKAAPTQTASDVKAFTIRDLLTLLYVDQDRMGARRAFFEDKPFKAIKWQAGFEIFHGLYDQIAAALSQALKEAQDEERSLQQYFRNARSFLDDFKIPAADVLQERIATLKLEQERLEARIKELRQTGEAQLGDNLELVRRRAALDAERSTVAARSGELRRTLVQLGRLRVQYERERAQLEFLRESQVLVGDLPVIRCPACLQGIEPTPDAAACYVCHRPVPAREGEVSVDARLRASRRRIDDLERYIGELESMLADLDDRTNVLTAEIREVDGGLQRMRQAAVLPDTTALLDVSEALSIVDRQRRQLAEHLELRRRSRGEDSTLTALADRVARLQRELELAESGRKSPEDVLRGLSDRFVAALVAFRFPDLRGATIDAKTYHPLVRGQPYAHLSSKGAISLVIVAWHAALLGYALSDGSRFPRVLMLDSPLSHVGHNNADEQFRDQQIVDGFYKYLADLHREAAPNFQLILVHNSPPPRAKDLPTIRFTGDPTHGRYGLIDDEHPPMPESPAG